MGIFRQVRASPEKGNLGKEIEYQKNFLMIQRKFLTDRIWEVAQVQFEFLTLINENKNEKYGDLVSSVSPRKDIGLIAHVTFF